MDSLQLAAKLESLDGFRSFVFPKAEGNERLKSIVPDLDLVLEEVLTNIIYYAYPSGQGDIQLECEIVNEGELLIRIKDWGIPFNPLEKDPPDLTLDISEREIGGLGIFLVRRLAREIDYKREGETNVLTLLFTAPED